MDVLKTVARALQVVELLGAQRRALSLTQIARHLQVNPSTAHHLLSTLRTRGYVEQDASSAYRLSLRLLLIGSGAPAVGDLRNVAEPVLRRLASRSGETASLVVRDQFQGVCLEQVQSPRLVAVTGYVGQRFPLHCTATGKALLAWLPPQEVRRIVSAAGLRHLTPRTITEPTQLQRELARVRRTGVAYDRGERTADVRCAAAPIVNHTGEVIAAVSLSGPAHRLSELRLRELGKLVQVACQEISSHLGWKQQAPVRSAARTGSDAGD